jgi:hypothetical protein
MEKIKSQQAPSSTKQPSTARAVLAGLFGVVAMLFFIPMVFSIWVNMTLLNSVNFSKSVTAVIIDPKVSKQIAQQLTNSIVTDSTIGDISASVLTPEEASQSPEQVMESVKKIFNDSLVQIIASKNVQNTASDLVKSLHKSLIESPPKNADRATVDFRPFITAVVNGANGTRIAVITTKFTLEDGQGVAEITPEQYRLIQSIATTARTTLVVQSVIFVLGVLLSVAIANRRFKVLRRILLTCGILLVAVGLPLYLIPMILSGSSQADISATFTGVGLLLNSLSLTMLVTGGVLIVAVIISNIIVKVSSKKPKVVEKPSTAEPKSDTVKPKPAPNPNKK